MTQGIIVFGSYLLTDIVEQLHEDTKRFNSVERLTRYLNKGTSPVTLKSQFTTVCKQNPKETVIHIDDSDVIKPDGYKFKALGLVRNGSKRTASKTVYGKRKWSHNLRHLYINNFHVLPPTGTDAMRYSMLLYMCTLQMPSQNTLTPK